jgi:hypothetical protein
MARTDGSDDWVNEGVRGAGFGLVARVREFRRQRKPVKPRGVVR